MKERVAQALRDALALMNDSGAHWTQGELVQGKRFCSVGAIWQVTGVNVRDLVEEEEITVQDLRLAGALRVADEAVTALSEAIAASRVRPLPTSNSDITHRYWNVTAWNDALGRTSDDVVEMFESAVQIIEQKEY